ncbi:MAG: efflux RND transporter periplasmic adaptor subunit [Planctomycetota bacterium]
MSSGVFDGQTQFAPECFVLSQHSEFKTRLLEVREQNVEDIDFFRAAIQTIAGNHKCLGFAIRGHQGAQITSEFSCSTKIPNAHHRELSEILASFMQKCQGEVGNFVSSVVEVAERKLLFLVFGFEAADSNFMVGFCVNEAENVELLAAKIEANLALVAANQFRPDAAGESDALEQSLELSTKVARYSTPQEFAFDLVQSLAERYDCQQVACGFRNKLRIDVQAVSGMSHFKASSPGIIDIQQAMEETLDAGTYCSYQPFGETQTHNRMPVHSRWGNANNTAVLSVPMLNGDDCVGVVSLSRDANVGFSQAEIGEFKQLLEPFGPAIALSKLGQRKLKEHALASAGDVWRKALQPKTKSGLILRFVAVLAAVFFVFGWLPYEPTIPCKLVPANLTQSLTPFDAQLKHVHVRSGDSVQKGQTLVMLDTRELELERARLIALRDQSSVDVRAALLRGDAANASLSQAAMRASQVQLDAVERKIALCTIQAPEDGMVVEADLEQRVGQVLPQGSMILSFAPMDQFELEIHVPEHTSRHIVADQKGVFASAGDPGNDMNFRVMSISGSAELVDGQNVFIARAELDGNSDKLRQGMEGFAKAHVGWRPIPWLAFHRIYEYACSHFWL